MAWHDNAPAENMEPPRMRFAALARRWGPLVVVAVAALVVWNRGWLDYLTLEEVARHRGQLVDDVADNRIAAIAVYCATYVVMVALSLPGGVFLTMLGGFLFGWLVGGTVTVFAATAGATVIFLIARSSLGAFLAERAGGWLDRLREGFERDSVSYLLFLRLVPAFPFWLVNIAPALLGMALPRYVLATFVGIIPGTFAFAFVGAGLDSIIAAHQAAYEDCLAEADEIGRAADTCTFTVDPSSLLTNETIAAFVALGIVALIPAVLRWRRRAGGAAAGPDRRR